MKLSSLEITKFEVADPGHYDSLITEQKKNVRNKPDDSEKWLELGRLFEAKALMTKKFSEESILIRLVPLFTVICFCFYTVYFVYLYNSQILPVEIIIGVFILCTLGMVYVLALRFPVSGEKYFKKAVMLDPDYAEAYMYLGLVALRKHKKQKACDFFEEAFQKGGNKKIERELKTIYQKEFIEFFNNRKDKEKALEERIESLENEITGLNADIKSLINKKQLAAKKEKNLKFETRQKMLKNKDDFEKTRGNYEQHIASLEEAMEREETKKEAAQRNFAALTLEIMEAKAFKEKTTFKQAKKEVKEIIGEKFWDSISESSQNCLITAEHAFSLLDKQSSETDFSLVGMELCKGLELEINDKLVKPFVAGLKDKQELFLKTGMVGEQKGVPVYNTWLARVVDKKNYPEVTGLTLGQFYYILKKTLEDEYTLREYGDFLHLFAKSSGRLLGRAFLQKLRTVTQDYRNAITHNNTHMLLGQCEHLRDLIFSGDDALIIL